MANFHFAWAGTDYLAAGLPPSPLQNFWTLSVEEQFYLVFPTIFLVIAGLRLRLQLGLRARLLLVLGVLSVCSLVWSVVQTNSNPSYAYFSPFTRAWELAVGSMVALAAPMLRKIPSGLAAALTWLGLGAIVLAGVAYDAQTPYPGIAVAVPVVGAALVISGGTANPRRGAEILLGLGPCRWLGRLSYSMYLWHWPILILAAESQGVSSLSVWSNLGWLVIALGASVVTYRLVESPVRHSVRLRGRSGASVAFGAGLIAATLIVANVATDVASPAPPVTIATRYGTNVHQPAVEALVRAAPSITSAPNRLTPPLSEATVGYPARSACYPIAYPQTSMTPCLAGDPHGAQSMVLYGDSHSAMWFQTVDHIATEAHWRLWYLGKSACPVELLPMMNPGDFGAVNGRFVQCDEWHRNAIATINRLRPDLVIVSQEVHPAPDGRAYTSQQWRAGLAAFFASVAVPGVRFDVIGNIPQLPTDPLTCLNAQADDVQACSAPRSLAASPDRRAEAEAVDAVGGRYVNVTPWFCSSVCTAVIGNFQVYLNQQHVMGPYAAFLAGVMADALRIPTGRDIPYALSTHVVFPLSGAVLGRSATTLVASAPVAASTRVQFVLTGPGYPGTVIAHATPSLFGWVAKWHLAGVPNGTYQLQTRVQNADGGSGLSAPVLIQVSH